MGALRLRQQPARQSLSVNGPAYRLSLGGLSQQHPRGIVAPLAHEPAVGANHRQLHTTEDGMATAARTCLFALVLLAPAALSAQEHVSFKPPPGWEMGAGPQETKDALLMEFVKKGEKLDAWTELITVQQVRRTKKSPPPRGFYDGVRTLQETRCPGLSEWQVLEEPEGEILYEWKTTATCAGHPPQVELVRLIYGRNTIYRHAYTTREPLTPEARATWIDWLQSAKLSR